jgi:ribosomal protein S18 acetylase RimI-like enzyme
MKAVRQTAQNAVKILGEFYAAHGAEVIRAAYGWEHKPVDRRGRFWAYYDEIDPQPGNLIGWGGMSFDTRDATDEEAMISVGVFPAYQRQGYRVKIYDHMVGVAKKLGAQRASLIVLKSNEAQYKRTMREAHAEGSPWIYAGDNWFPAPGYGYFVCPLT